MKGISLRMGGRLLHREVPVTLRVRYGETDQMGVAYYANYLTWFEVGRTEYCDAAGYPYARMEAGDHIGKIVLTIAERGARG